MNGKKRETHGEREREGGRAERRFTAAFRMALQNRRAIFFPRENPPAPARGERAAERTAFLGA